MAKKKKEKKEVKVKSEIKVKAGAEAQVKTKKEVVEVPVENENLIKDKKQIKKALEALLFAAPEALNLKKLKKHLSLNGFCTEDLKKHIEGLQKDYENKGIQVTLSHGAYIFRSNPDCSQIIRALREEKPVRLSKSALEVLAIIAYKQPVTRADLDHVRGTDSGHLIRGLLEKNLVITQGHKDTAGRPLLYGTTEYFLETFTLNTLDDLPDINEFQRELDGNTTNGEEEMLQGAPSALDAIADRGDFDSDTPEEEIHLPELHTDVEISEESVHAELNPAETTA